jgi:hypothetical protein
LSRFQERFVNQFTALQVVQDGAAHQIYGFLGWVIILSSSDPPMMNFGDGESQMVEFSPAFPNHGAFFLRTYQHGSC